MCKNCGEELSTDGKGTLVHAESGKYACYPNIGKLTEANREKWEAVATPGGFSEDENDDHSGHEHAQFVFGIICLI